MVRRPTTPGQLQPGFSQGSGVTDCVILDVGHREHSGPLALLLTLPNESGASYLLVGHSH